MANWFGKWWKLRIGLWLFAAALCFVIWPNLVGETLPRFRFGSSHYSYEWYSYFGNPVLLLDVRGSEAWDWKTGKRWRVPDDTTGPFEVRIDVVGDGRTLALAMMEPGRGIVIREIDPPHLKHVHRLPPDLGEAGLITIDPQMRFAVLECYEDEPAIRIVELATGQVVDSKINVDVYALGNGEVALTESHRTVTGPQHFTTWKVADDGQLVEIEMAPRAAEAEARSNSHSPEDTVVSPNGRFQAAQASNSRLVVRDRWNNRVLEKLPTSDWQLAHIAFSADSKCLLVGSPVTNLRVFDLETETLVADDHRVEYRWWRSSILMALSAIPLTLALPLAIRTPSFERMAWDYVLVTVFFESLTSALALHDEALPRGNATAGALMAIGVYWAFGPASLWKRLICGMIAIVVLVGVSAQTVAWVNQDDFVSRDLMLALLLSLSIATSCGLAAWLMTLPSGWRITSEETRCSPSRFQFGMGAICMAIAVVAIALATVGRYAEMGPSHLFSPNMIVPTSLFIVIGLFLFMATVWLTLWLCFLRSKSLTLLWVLTGAALMSVLIASLIKVLTANTLRWGDLDVTMLTPYQFLVMVGPLITQYAWFSLALCLARRHGYRWVKASKAVPAAVGAIGAAT